MEIRGFFFLSSGVANLLFFRGGHGIIRQQKKGGLLYFRIEGSDITSGRAVCRMTQAEDESAAEQWATDVAHIRVARIVLVGSPVWARGGGGAGAALSPAPVIAGGDEAQETVEESISPAEEEAEEPSSDPELISTSERRWSATLNERWEGETAASPTLPTGPLLPPPKPFLTIDQLPPAASEGLLASMRFKLSRPREPLGPIELVLLGLISLDVCAVLGLMVRGTLGAEPVDSVMQLYAIAIVVNLPALLAIVAGWVYGRKTGKPSPQRQMAIAFFVLVAGIFVVTVAISTGQLTTRDTLAEQTRIHNSHRPSIARERAQLAEMAQR